MSYSEIIRWRKIRDIVERDMRYMANPKVLAVYLELLNNCNIEIERLKKVK